MSYQFTWKEMKYLSKYEFVQGVADQYVAESRASSAYELLPVIQTGQQSWSHHWHGHVLDMLAYIRLIQVSVWQVLFSTLTWHYFSCSILWKGHWINNYHSYKIFNIDCQAMCRLKHVKQKKITDSNFKSMAV